MNLPALGGAKLFSYRLELSALVLEVAIAGLSVSADPLL